MLAMSTILNIGVRVDAVVLISVALIFCGDSSFHIAPVNGSTISIPTRPPISMLPKYHPLSVKVTGIIFFDKSGHGNGHAENGIEIHPIFEISKAN